jgi:glycosyltransferase involved in cell wall biosynthesis
MSDHVAVLILTFNSASVIEQTVRAARQVSATIIAVDSGSTDGTMEILRQLGCETHQRPFKHYADQRNWAIETFGNNHAWQLHLDADEIMDAELAASIGAALRDPRGRDGFVLHRRTYFLGHPLRYGGASNWHMRLFRSGCGRCEDRLYDQHFICSGPVAILRGWLQDMNVGSLTEWTARHNRWSDLEAQELLRTPGRSGRLEARLSGDPRQRRRMYKGIYYHAPSYVRAWLLFFYRYCLQLGFLDGRVGFLYAFFQALWFRMLVDAKLLEAGNIGARVAAGAELVGEGHTHSPTSQ